MRVGLLAMAGVLALVVLAFLLSPRPSVALIRTVFDKGAAEASAKLEPVVPAAVSTRTVRYDANDRDALFDIHSPENVRASAPTIVWIHGGGFVSGRRRDITNYAKVLVGQGFNVVNVDYTIAPEAQYPTPVRQVNRALAYIALNGASLGINPQRLVLAGDSAGAQIAAQTAAVVTNPAYARLIGVVPGIAPEQLAGALLYCGVYDISGLGTGGGILGWFIESAGWAYSGKRKWRDDRVFQTMSIAPYVTSSFPPAFVSAGNADPLGPQSVAMAKSLESANVAVEQLFFPADYKPGLGHEYQFDLTTQAGQKALAKSGAWLNSL